MARPTPLRSLTERSKIEVSISKASLDYSSPCSNFATIKRPIMIFLSYATEDRDRASRIYSLISKPRRPVFYDKESLVPGMDWEAEIESKLAQCALILILFSRHSVNKEGFVQREIRLALSRAERMPEGRIFIVPIRFDGTEVPSRLMRYHWLDINSDADYFELEYFVDLIWDRVTGVRKEPDATEVNDVAFTEDTEANGVVLKEKVVVLLQGKNLNSEMIYTYLKLPLWKLIQLRDKLLRREDFQPTDYGEVLAAAKGEPTNEVRQEMALLHNMVDVPKPGSGRTAREIEKTTAYLTGFAEGYLSVCGDSSQPPLVDVPDQLVNYSNPLREGVRHGIRVALSHQKEEAANMQGNDSAT